LFVVGKKCTQGGLVNGLIEASHILFAVAILAFGLVVVLGFAWLVGKGISKISGDEENDKKERKAVAKVIVACALVWAVSLGLGWLLYYLGGGTAT
jgi:hypothetical protein